MTTQTPTRIGKKWFIREEDSVKEVTHQWVKNFYPKLASTSELCDIIEYIEKKIKTKHITIGVGKNLLRRLKDVVKDANKG
jgi:hypothetical protein